MSQQVLYPLQYKFYIYTNYFSILFITYTKNRILRHLIMAQKIKGHLYISIVIGMNVVVL